MSDDEYLNIHCQKQNSVIHMHSGLFEDAQIVYYFSFSQNYTWYLAYNFLCDNVLPVCGSTINNNVIECNAHTHILSVSYFGSAGNFKASQRDVNNPVLSQPVSRRPRSAEKSPPLTPTYVHCPVLHTYSLPGMTNPQFVQHIEFPLPHPRVINACSVVR